jgi:hypothetical protein
MTFPEKSALTMTAILLAVFGWYFWLVLGPIAGAGSPARDYAYTAVMGVALAAVTVLATVSHIILAIVFHRQANVRDERDRLINLRSTRIACYLLVTGVFAGLGLAVARADRFWIAQVLVASLVLASVVESVVKVALYRRSA